MTGRQMVKLYKRNGWEVMRVSRGSHYQMEKKGNRAAIPHHTVELPKWLEEKSLKILKEVG